MEEDNKDFNLKEKTLSAFRWLAIGKFLGQFISWAVTLLVIRLLTPADYGLMSMSMVFISILSLLNELGLGAAIIQAEEIDQHTLQKVFGVVLIINTGLFFLMFAAAPLVGLFFHESQVIPLIRVLSVQFLLMGFNIIPQSLLAREMDFKKKSIVDMIANLMGSFTTLSLAFSGKGVWSLIFGSVMIAVAGTVGLNIALPFWHRPIFSFKGLNKIISFGSFVMIEKVIWYFYSQADVLIIGRLLGKELLGFYSVGKHIASLPSQKVSPIVNQVVFPAFSRIQKQLDKVSAYVLKGVRLMSYISFPVFMGISSVAPEFVGIILGEKWMMSAAIIIWASLIIPLQMTNTIIVSVLKGLGRADVSLKNVLTASVIMPVSFLIGCRWGIVGVSLAWTFAYPLYFLTAILRSSSHMALKPMNIFKSMFVPLVASLAMYAVIVVFKLCFKTDPSSIPWFIFLVIIGTGVYAGMMRMLEPESFSEVREVIRR